jgi:hypothetical protein
LLSAIWDTIKGFFGGKAGMQFGSGNRSTSGFTVGDTKGPVIIGDGNQLHIGPDQGPTRTDKPDEGAAHILAQPSSDHKKKMEELDIQQRKDALEMSRRLFDELFRRENEQVQVAVTPRQGVG